jgi:hypothetical protein
LNISLKNKQKFHLINSATKMSEFIEQTVCKTTDLQNNELVLLLVKDLIKKLITELMTDKS